MKSILVYAALIENMRDYSMFIYHLNRSEGLFDLWPIIVLPPKIHFAVALYIFYVPCHPSFHPPLISSAQENSEPQGAIGHDAPRVRGHKRNKGHSRNVSFSQIEGRFNCKVMILISSFSAVFTMKGNILHSFKIPHCTLTFPCIPIIIQFNENWVGTSVMIRTMHTNSITISLGEIVSTI